MSLPTRVTLIIFALGILMGLFSIFFLLFCYKIFMKKKVSEIKPPKHNEEQLSFYHHHPSSSFLDDSFKIDDIPTLNSLLDVIEGREKISIDDVTEYTPVEHCVRKSKHVMLMPFVRVKVEPVGRRTYNFYRHYNYLKICNKYQSFKIPLKQKNKTQRCSLFHKRPHKCLFNMTSFKKNEKLSKNNVAKSMTYACLTSQRRASHVRRSRSISVSLLKNLNRSKTLQRVAMLFGDKEGGLLRKTMKINGGNEKENKDQKSEFKSSRMDNSMGRVIDESSHEDRGTTNNKNKINNDQKIDNKKKEIENTLSGTENKQKEAKIMQKEIKNVKTKLNKVTKHKENEEKNLQKETQTTQKQAKHIQIETKTNKKEARNIEEETENKQIETKTSQNQSKSNQKNTASNQNTSTNDTNNKAGSHQEINLWDLRAFYATNQESEISQLEDSANSSSGSDSDHQPRHTISVHCESLDGHLASKRQSVGNIKMDDKGAIKTSSLEENPKNLFHRSSFRREKYQNFLKNKQKYNRIEVSIEPKTTEILSKIQANSTVETSVEENEENVGSTNKLENFRNDSGYKSLENQRSMSLKQDSKLFKHIPQGVIREDQAAEEDEKMRMNMKSLISMKKRLLIMKEANEVYDECVSLEAEKKRIDYKRGQFFKMQDNTADFDKQNSEHHKLAVKNLNAKQNVSSFVRAYSQKTLSTLPRDYSIDEQSNVLFNEFQRYDPELEDKNSIFSKGQKRPGYQGTRKRLRRFNTNPLYLATTGTFNKRKLFKGEKQLNQDSKATSKSFNEQNSQMIFEGSQHRFKDKIPYPPKNIPVIELTEEDEPAEKNED